MPNFFFFISASEILKVKSNHSTAKIEPCVDKRLKKVFLEQSLITVEDLNKVKFLHPVLNF